MFSVQARLTGVRARVSGRLFFVALLPVLTRLITYNNRQMTDKKKHYSINQKNKQCNKRDELALAREWVCRLL